MIRNAVVLCAGEGSRLRPLTFSRPKHLLPVAGRPIIGWALETLAEAGIERVALIVGHHAEAIRRYVGAGQDWRLDVSYIEQIRPLGIGHAVGLAQPFVDQDKFIVYLGDNLFQDGITDFATSLAGGSWDAGLLLKKVDDPRKFGVAEVEGDHVIGVVEKPVDPASDLAIVGVYAFTPEIFEQIERLEPSARGEIEITDAIQSVLTGGGVIRWSQLTNGWEDTGEPRSLLRANHSWLQHKTSGMVEGSIENCEIQGKVTIDRGTRATNSRFIGPCRVGGNCTIRDSVIGPDVSLDDGCEVESSQLLNCIVQRNSQIRHLAPRLVDSVLGERVEIQGWSGQTQTTHLSFLLGDMAAVKAM